MQGLADVGSMAYPPASPILKLLNGFGQALVNTDLNDIEFRYSMVLDPKGGLDNLSHFNLEAGNYVIIRCDRKENQESNIPWDELALDENEGIVCWKTKFDDIKVIDEEGNIKKEKKNRPYIDNTYLIVEINKNVSSVHIDLSQTSYDTLLTALKSKDKEKAANLTSMSKAVGEVIIPRAQTINFNTGKELLYDIKKNKTSITSQSHAEKLLQMLQKSLNGQGELREMINNDVATAPLLSSEQVDYLLSELESIAGQRLTRVEVADSSKKDILLQKILGNTTLAGNSEGTTPKSIEPANKREIRQKVKDVDK